MILLIELANMKCYFDKEQNSKNGLLFYLSCIHRHVQNPVFNNTKIKTIVTA